MHLAVDEQRVEDAPAVVDRDVTERLDPAGLGVDLDDGDVRAERERGARRLEVVLDVERVTLLVGLAGELGPRERRRRHAGDAEPCRRSIHDVVG